MTIRSGDLTNCFLAISTISGMILIMQYDASRPLDSTVSINSIIPFGWLWRGIHYWSSQFFLITFLYHLFENISSLRENPSFRKQWLVLLLSAYMSILLVFTGYILRWDELGKSAGNIATELTKCIPLFGNFINAVFFDIKGDSLFKILGLHVNLTLVIWLIGSWYHIKGIKISKGGLILSLLISISFTLIILPKLHALSNTTTHTNGPWFFVAVQELLRYFHPLIAGILYPFIPLFAMSFLVITENYARICNIILKFWALSYIILTITGFMRND